MEKQVRFWNYYRIEDAAMRREHAQRRNEVDMVIQTLQAAAPFPTIHGRSSSFPRFSLFFFPDGGCFTGKSHGPEKDHCRLPSGAGR